MVKVEHFPFSWQVKPLPRQACLLMMPDAYVRVEHIVEDHVGDVKSSCLTVVVALLVHIGFSWHWAGI